LTSIRLTAGIAGWLLLSACSDLTAPHATPSESVTATVIAPPADLSLLVTIGSTLEDATGTFLPSLTDPSRRREFGALLTALSAQLVAGNGEKATPLLARARSILATADQNEAVEYGPLALALDQVEAALPATLAANNAESIIP